MSLRVCQSWKPCRPTSGSRAWMVCADLTTRGSADILLAQHSDPAQVRDPGPLRIARPLAVGNLYRDGVGHSNVLHGPRGCGPQAGIGSVNGLSPEPPYPPRRTACHGTFCCPGVCRNGVEWSLGWDQRIMHKDYTLATRRRLRLMLLSAPPPSLRDREAPHRGRLRRGRCRSRERAFPPPSPGA